MAPSTDDVSWPVDSNGESMCRPRRPLACFRPHSPKKTPPYLKWVGDIFCSMEAALFCMPSHFAGWGIISHTKTSLPLQYSQLIPITGGLIIGD